MLLDMYILATIWDYKQGIKTLACKRTILGLYYNWVYMNNCPFLRQRGKLQKLIMADDVSKKRSRIILWCVPHTTSTAFLKCLSAIEGIEIWFEPYSFCCKARDTYLGQYQSIESYPVEYSGSEAVFAKAAQSVTKYMDMTLNLAYLRK